jgi:peroxiredoxin
MKRNILMSAFPALCLAVTLSGQTAPDDSTTLTRIGQTPPRFHATLLDGRGFEPAAYRGRVVLLAFFATWCGACRMELPEIQKNLWEPFRNGGLSVVCIGREHTRAELDTFRTANRLTMDFAPDTGRAIFKLFATRNIPRCVLIGKDGIIRYQTLGYDPAGFRELTDRVAAALKE